MLNGTTTLTTVELFFSWVPTDLPFPDFKKLQILFPFPHTFSSTKQRNKQTTNPNRSTNPPPQKVEIWDYKSIKAFITLTNVDLSLSSELQDLSPTVTRRESRETERVWVRLSEEKRKKKRCFWRERTCERCVSGTVVKFETQRNVEIK